MADADSWEARMAARARARQPEPAVKPIDRKCAICGFESERSLRYGNLETGEGYCSDECVRQSPGWDDNSFWMAGSALGGQP